MRVGVGANVIWTSDVTVGVSLAYATKYTGGDADINCKLRLETSSYRGESRPVRNRSVKLVVRRS